VDVFHRQVGGPEDARARALIQPNGDGELGLAQCSRAPRLVELGCAAAVAADGQIAEINVDAVGVDLRAGVADGCDQAAPVGIAAGPGGLHQRRMGDGLGDLEGVGVGRRSFDCSSTTCVMPSPSATTCRASDVQTWVKRGGELGA
jgi:hypothetical protein